MTPHPHGPDVALLGIGAALGGMLILLGRAIGEPSIWCPILQSAGLILAGLFAVLAMPWEER